ncbi:hypothetical protein HDV05_005834 [Chytridiales sp. JEL 0842]|nr:hypothetical protein HDV05_005834 [Chytridiales sp. JEL 0842]
MFVRKLNRVTASDNTEEGLSAKEEKLHAPVSDATTEPAKAPSHATVNLDESPNDHLTMQQLQTSEDNDHLTAKSRQEATAMYTSSSILFTSNMPKRSPTKSMTTTLMKRAITTIGNIQHGDVSTELKTFDPRIASRIESLTSTMVDFGSVFVGATVAAFYTSDEGWASCNGTTDTTIIIYKLLFAVAFLFISEILTTYFEERFVGYSMREIVTELEQIKMGIRGYFGYTFMVLAALGIILCVEAGLYNSNPCFASGRIRG